MPVVDFTALLIATVAIGDAGWAGLVYTSAAVVALALFGDYRFRIVPRLDVATWWTLAHLALPLAFLGLVLEGDAARSLFLSVPAGVGLLLAGRGALFALERGARRRRLVAEPTLIVGSGEVAMTVAHSLFRHPEHGMLPIGILDDDVDGPTFPPVMGPVHSLEQVIEEYEVRRVVVAFGAVPEHELVTLLRRCALHRAEMYVTPRFFELATARASTTDHIRGIPLVALKRSAFRPPGRVVKRAFDVAVSGAALVLLAPVMLAVAVAVRLSGPGPILFKQQRVGQHGEPIEVLKFRSLRPNEEADTTWSIDSTDDRVTPIGRFIRRTSLDELPQLLNVVRGDMSVVGPRPERPYFSAQFEEEIAGYRDRQRLPGGVTGWAQVHGLRGDTSIAERSRFDNHYIEHWSPWLDVVICLRTVRTLFRNHD